MRKNQVTSLHGKILSLDRHILFQNTLRFHIVLGIEPQKNKPEANTDKFDELEFKLKTQFKKILDHLLRWRSLLNYSILLGLLIGLGFFVEQIFANFISKASSFKVNLKNEEFEIESPTVMFCFNPGLKASALKESAKYHNGEYELQPIFYTNFLISGSIDNTTDILSKSFFKLGEDFTLIGNMNDFGHKRSTILEEGSNTIFNAITRQYSLEVKVEKIISSLFGLCYQIIPNFKMNPNTYLFFKIIFNNEMKEEDRPKVQGVPFEELQK